jgi:hypothetical protein
LPKLISDPLDRATRADRRVLYHEVAARGRSPARFGMLEIAVRRRLAVASAGVHSSTATAISPLPQTVWRPTPVQRAASR